MNGYAMKNPADDGAVQQLHGIAGVMHNYDGVILDLWGVVHNGVAPFEGVIPALRQLKAAGKAIWLLSNAPRRANVVRGQLAGMGIDGALYDGLLTSGEATHEALRDDLLARWGNCCLPLGAMYCDDLLGGLDCTQVSRIEDADFILATGVPGNSLDANRALLSAAAARGVPMLCANPDRVVHVGADLYLCPGTLAVHYETLGGQVVWYGKPYAAVYDHVLAHMPSRRILAVGDGMPTDVKGAIDAGIDVALVTAGIHREALFGDIAPDVSLGARMVAQNRLQALITAEGVKPSFIINALAW